MKCRVWDTLNSCEEFAWEIEADDAEEAAIEYAERDTDGQADGLYLADNGGPLSPAYGQQVAVRDETGRKLVFRVSIEELEPVWGAHLESGDE